MPEEILEGIYRLEIPIPNNPLKALNCYVIPEGNEALVIDTGLNRTECIDALRRGLENLGVSVAKARFFLTHMHADHVGMITSLTNKNTITFCSSLDAASINDYATSDARWIMFQKLSCLNGFPPDDALDALQRHPGKKFGPKGHTDFTVVENGAEIKAGDYTFKCVATPGHTRGHMCLYESSRKILISGDHLLRDITPNISVWSDDYDPLAAYMQSLEKIRALDIKTVLPGHRRIFHDCNTRIDELIAHHHRRLDEAMSIVASGKLTAFEVAGRMKWDLTYTSWNDFPAPQKWFATGEALAHLKYLESTGRVEYELIDGQRFYFC